MSAYLFLLDMAFRMIGFFRQFVQGIDYDFLGMFHLA